MLLLFLLSFCGKIAALISSIPNCVLGGMSILLYGVIASNGLRILIDEKVDFSKQRNLIIASAMLVIGLGGAVFPLGGSATLSGTALAAIVGVLLNLILPMNSKFKNFFKSSFFIYSTQVLTVLNKSNILFLANLIAEC